MSYDDDTERRTAADSDEPSDRRRDFARNPNESGKWVSALIALVGLWLLLETLLFDLAQAEMWNEVLVGLLLLAVGGYNYYRQSEGRYGSAGAAAVAALLGLWLIVTPFVFNTVFSLTPVDENLPVWSDIVSGLLALGFGAYSAYRIREGLEATTGTVA